MEKMIYLNCLFDLYGNLLTEKQQLYFKDYYFDNLTLEEISENDAVSKNAVSKHLKAAKKLLEKLEKRGKKC